MKKIFKAFLRLFEPTPDLTISQKLILFHILNATPQRRL